MSLLHLRVEFQSPIQMLEGSIRFLKRLDYRQLEETDWVARMPFHIPIQVPEGFGQSSCPRQPHNYIL
ncbi:hypothetical protein SBA2_810015 [Acidobacteriia bacterium SbA2]|nr:hypothetical protein SBA2_810015 [Acidobacteriia bacterium SbA2]